MSERQPTIDQMMGEVYLLQQKQNKIVLDIITNLVQQLGQAQKLLQEHAKKNADVVEMKPKKDKK